MITIYPIVFNTLFNINTFQIVIIINLINKVFIFNKNICLSTIHKYINISYIIIDFIKIFITITAISITIFKPFTIIQIKAIFGFRYQYIFLTSTSFENDIFVINVEFILTLKTEATLIIKYTAKTNLYFNLEFTLYINNLLKSAFSISINDTVYTIITDTIQRKEKVLVATS